MIFYYESGQFELFNVAKDLGEEHDLADDYPTMRNELADELRSYLQEVEAQFPIDKKSGKPIVIPGRVGVADERR